MKIAQMLKERQLPALLSREEMIQILMEDQYGYMPEIPYEISISEPEIKEERYCSAPIPDDAIPNDRYCPGTVTHSTVQFTVTTQYGSVTIPVQRILHTDGSVNPFFIYLSFSRNVPDKYYPTEEVAENGFDVLTVSIDDISTDDNDFTNGLPSIFIPNGRQKSNDAGKITYWAWFASRMLDYAQTLPSLDIKQAAILGHSRLGKTALVAGMLDERFRYSFSNCSGCSGAALARGNSGNPLQEDYEMETIFSKDREMSKGETIRDIVKYFPFFSCRNYHKYITTNIPEGYDQHFLVASIAPRFVFITSASKDPWADPVSEFLCGVAASEAYEALGLKGLVHNDKLPEVGESFHEGRIGYHLCNSTHFLSRHNWAQYMAYIRRHQND